MTILIVTRSDDDHAVLRVREELEALGYAE